MTHHTISPSEVACRAIRAVPLGDPSKHTFCCALCGHFVQPGQLFLPYVPKSSFTDYSSMADPAGTKICGWCAVVLEEQRFTQQWASSVICSDGVFKANTNMEQAYWLLNPPDGPYLWLKLCAKRQHLVWRAPVNVGPGIARIRFGEVVFSIRRRLLPTAVEVARRMANLRPDENAAADSIQPLKSGKHRKSPKVKLRNTPFVGADRGMTSSLHGAIHPDVLKAAAANPVHHADLAALRSLTPGETWALTSLLYVPDQLERPIQLA